MQDREQKLFIVGFFFPPVKISRPALFIKVFWRILSSEELNPLITVVSRHILCQKKTVHVSLWIKNSYQLPFKGVYSTNDISSFLIRGLNWMVTYDDA